MPLVSTILKNMDAPKKPDSKLGLERVAKNIDNDDNAINIVTGNVRSSSINSTIWILFGLAIPVGLLLFFRRKDNIKKNEKIF